MMEQNQKPVDLLLITKIRRSIMEIREIVTLVHQRCFMGWYVVIQTVMEYRMRI